MTAKSSRRDFFKTTVKATAAVAAGNLIPGTLGAKEKTGIAIVVDPQDSQQKPVQWVAGELRAALERRSVHAKIVESWEQAPAGFDCIIAAMASSRHGKQALGAAGIALPNVQES